MSFRVFNSEKSKLNKVLVCKSKVKYTNETSVKRAQSALGREYGCKMDYYRCGTSKHYHLTHADPSQRIGHGAKI